MDTRSKLDLKARIEKLLSIVYCLFHHQGDCGDDHTRSLDEVIVDNMDLDQFLHEKFGQ